MHKAVNEKITLDCRDSPHHSRIGGRQEADCGDQQQARIKRLRSVGLNKRSELRIEPIAAYLTHEFPSAPASSGRVRPAHGQLLDCLDGAIEGHPCHYLGIGEVLRRSAWIPPSAGSARAARRTSAVSRSSSGARSTARGAPGHERFDAEPALAALRDPAAVDPRLTRPDALRACLDAGLRARPRYGGRCSAGDAIAPALLERAARPGSPSPRPTG